MVQVIILIGIATIVIDIKMITDLKVFRNVLA